MLLKTPRFIKEYANYQKKYLDNCNLMKDSIRQELKDNIDRAVNAYANGFITVDETMRLLALDGLDFSTGLRY